MSIAVPVQKLQLTGHNETFCFSLLPQKLLKVLFLNNESENEDGRTDRLTDPARGSVRFVGIRSSTRGENMPSSSKGQDGVTNEWTDIKRWKV